MKTAPVTLLRREQARRRRFAARLLKALDEAEDVARDAVSYVGAANYAHREIDAQNKIRMAFEALRELVNTPRRTA